MPDLDALVYLPGGRDAYMFEHRGPTHGLLGAAALALVVAVGARLSRRVRSLEGGEPASFLACLAMAAVGLASHLALDVPTSWGTCLFSPFSDERVALDWVFIVDGAMLAILAAPFALKRAGWTPRRASALALFLLAAYYAVAGTVHAGVRAGIAERAQRDAGGRAGVAWLRVFPSPLAPLAWFGVARTSEERYRVYRVSVLGREDPWEVPTGLDLPQLARARGASPVVSRYLWWASAPCAEVTDGPSGPVLLLSDLRFRSSRLYPEGSFRLRVPLAPDGTPVAHLWE